MVDTRALRAREGKIFVRVRVSPSAPNFGDEFDGRMLALGARGTGSNSLVPDLFCYNKLSRG